MVLIPIVFRQTAPCKYQSFKSFLMIYSGLRLISIIIYSQIAKSTSLLQAYMFSMPIWLSSLIFRQQLLHILIFYIIPNDLQRLTIYCYYYIVPNLQVNFLPSSLYVLYVYMVLIPNISVNCSR